MSFKAPTKTGSASYEISPASYIGYHNGICSIKIMSNNMFPDMLTLGLNFFENYYVVFDLESQRVGMVESKFSKNVLSREQGFMFSALSFMNLSQSSSEAFYQQP